MAVAHGPRLRPRGQSTFENHGFQHLGGPTITGLGRQSGSARTKTAFWIGVHFFWTGSSHAKIATCDIMPRRCQARISSKAFHSRGFSRSRHDCGPRPPASFACFKHGSHLWPAANERQASQSNTQFQANPDPCGSLSVCAAKGQHTSGSSTPLRFELVPPTVKPGAIAKSGPQRATKSANFFRHSTNKVGAFFQRGHLGNGAGRPRLRRPRQGPDPAGTPHLQPVFFLAIGKTARPAAWARRSARIRE